MVNIALRRSSKRAPTDIKVVPRSKVQNRVRQDNQSPDIDDGSDSDSEDGSSSPKSPKGPPSPKSPDSPSSTTQTFAPTLPPATTTNVLPPPAPTSIIAPPPPAVTTQPAVIQPVVTQPVVTQPVATTQPAATTPVQPAPPPAQTSATVTTVPTTTLAGPVTTLTPIAPPQLPVTTTSVPVLVKDPARETDGTTSEPPSPTSPVTSLPQLTTTALASPFTTLTPIAPPRTTTSSSIDSTTTSSGQSTAATSSPSSTSSGATTLVTTRFVLSSTSVVDGIPTTLLITLPSAPATTLLTRTSSTSTSTRQKETITSGAGLVPVESAAPITLPSNTTASPSGDSRDSLSNAPGVLSVGGVAALSLIIALASIATIVFVAYKCCWPRLSRGRPASAVLPAWVPGRRFWDKPRPAARGIGPTAPDMAHVRPGDKIMDQVMAAAYEAEQGNAGVYGRYAAERRGSWHTDNSSILEEKQRQYEAAVAASAINGTAPPDPRKSKALHLGQMMNAFLKDRHERPAASAQEVEMPHSPPGMTSGPTAFMPKNHQVEWSWRVSVRRASQNLRGGEGGDGWFSKVARLGGSKS